MRMMRLAAIFILVCLTTFAGAARAQDAAASDPLQELAVLKKYGATHKSCDGWSDSCNLCARRADGSFGCTRIGVGCQVTEIECTQLARDPKTGKTPPPPQ